MRSKLNDEQKMFIEEWLITGRNASGGPIHWTLKKLKREIEKEFGIEIGTTPLWKHMLGMGLVLKKPRPIHAKANQEEQEGFKKPNMSAHTYVAHDIQIEVADNRLKSARKVTIGPYRRKLYNALR